MGFPAVERLVLGMGTIPLYRSYSTERELIAHIAFLCSSHTIEDLIAEEGGLADVQLTCKSISCIMLSHYRTEDVMPLSESCKIHC